MGSVLPAPTLSSHGRFGLAEASDAAPLEPEIAQRLGSASSVGRVTVLHNSDRPKRAQLSLPFLLLERMRRIICDRPLYPFGPRCGDAQGAVPAPNAAELDRLVRAAPPMTGAEYLTTQVLGALWDEERHGKGLPPTNLPFPIAPVRSSSHAVVRIERACANMWRRRDTALAHGWIGNPDLLFRLHNVDENELIAGAGKALPQAGRRPRGLRSSAAKSFRLSLVWTSRTALKPIPACPALPRRKEKRGKAFNGGVDCDAPSFRRVSANGSTRVAAESGVRFRSSSMKFGLGVSAASPECPCSSGRWSRHEPALRWRMEVYDQGPQRLIGPRPIHRRICTPDGS
jgi:hypothetical protein